MVVRAFCRAAPQLPDVDLLIVGPWQFDRSARHDVARVRQIDALCELVRQVGLTGRVHWCGPQEDVVPFLQVADLFFFPTRREGLPNALAEAMACGLPTLASDLEGVTTDLVENGVHGHLISGHDPEHYAVALTQMLGQPERLAAMAAAATCRAQSYGIERIVQQYDQLFSRLQRHAMGPDEPEHARKSRYRW